MTVLRYTLEVIATNLCCMSERQVCHAVLLVNGFPKKIVIYGTVKPFPLTSHSSALLAAIKVQCFYPCTANLLSVLVQLWLRSVLTRLYSQAVKDVEVKILILVPTFL